MIVRPEEPQDETAIRALIAAAFVGHPHSDGSEPAIVDGLRAAGALTISLVAVDAAGEIVGHIAFSPVTLSKTEGDYLGLGPLAVAIEHQRQGVGRGLVEEGLALANQRGADGVVVMGDPAYYSRFGFVSDAGVSMPGVAPQYFSVLTLSGRPASGIVGYHPAFTGGAED
ncbi:putative acetyltransferase [Rhizobium sp. RU20A]|uniref:GNAT family N-acetyltransferase n=1 Tax=Rhizobium sp. RU20A TaxID=1907412 RepID=UPI0009542A45|nr:N-acetyltransferase [Rhizobium sp. RU20A]SIQ03696.1 putative acetyltransferase [Rhizobium sp. RU20A]